MTNRKQIRLLLASLLLSSYAFAQTREGAFNPAVPQPEILAARIPYTQATVVPPDNNNDNNNSDQKSLAQRPRRGPQPPPPPVYPRADYPSRWTGHGNPAHTLLGAAIGFGVGAAIGAATGNQNAPRGGRVIIGGALFALFGGCIGQAIPAHHSMRFRRRPWPGGDGEDDDLRSHSSESHKQTTTSARRAAPSQPAVPGN